MFKMTILVYFTRRKPSYFGLSTEVKIVNFIMREFLIATIFKYTMSPKKYSVPAYSLFQLCNFPFLLQVSPVVHFSQWLINKKSIAHLTINFTLHNTRYKIHTDVKVHVLQDHEYFSENGL